MNKDYNNSDALVMQAAVALAGRVHELAIKEHGVPGVICLLDSMWMPDKLHQELSELPAMWARISARLCLHEYRKTLPPSYQAELTSDDVLADETGYFQQRYEWLANSSFFNELIRLAKQHAPDALCVTLPDGSCVSPHACMHGA